MKNTSWLALSIAALLAWSPEADARPRPAGGSSMKKFEANKTFGLGLELGEPTGLIGKWFLSSSGALDFGLGYIYGHYYAGDGIHLYADYLWHPFSFVSAEAFELPFYFGVGGRFWDFDYRYGCDRNGRNCIVDDGASAIGVRAPVGISFDFNKIPLDAFVQFAPTLDFYRDYYDRNGDRRRFHLGVDFSIGARFWFN